MNTLIVSGNGETAGLLKRILASRLGYKEVLAVSKGADGILSIKDKSYMDSAGVLFGKKPVKACDYRLLIIDDDIPDIPVLVFVQAVRKLFGKTILPVILMTSGENRDEIMDVLKAGANGFLLKPLSGGLVKSKLEEIVGVEGGMVTSASSFFLKGELKTKGGGGSSTLKRMSSGGKSRGGSAPIGAYYAAGKKSKKEEGEDSPMVDDGSLINGHYHEEVDIIGGGTNCVWGKEKSGSGEVVLEYVSAKGKATGIHVKTIPKEEFLRSYKACTPDTCDILKRVGT